MHRGIGLVLDKGLRHAIHWAAAEGDPMCLTLLCQAFPDHVNDKDVDSLTPLHYAVYRDRALGARILFEHGGDLRAKNNRGEDPVAYTKRRLMEDWNKKFPVKHHSASRGSAHTASSSSSSDLYTEHEEASVVSQELSHSSRPVQNPNNSRAPSLLKRVNDKLVSIFKQPHAALQGNETLSLLASGELVGNSELLRVRQNNTNEARNKERSRNFFGRSAFPTLLIVAFALFETILYFQGTVHHPKARGMVVRFVLVSFFGLCCQFSDPGRLPLSPHEDYSNGLSSLLSLLHTHTAHRDNAATEEGKAGEHLTDRSRAWIDVYHLNNPLVLFFALVAALMSALRALFVRLCKLIYRVSPPPLQPFLHILRKPLCWIDDHFAFLPVRMAFGYDLAPCVLPSSSPELASGQHWQTPTASRVYNTHAHPGPFPAPHTDRWIAEHSNGEDNTQKEEKEQKEERFTQAVEKMKHRAEEEIGPQNEAIDLSFLTSDAPIPSSFPSSKDSFSNSGTFTPPLTWRMKDCTDLRREYNDVCLFRIIFCFFYIHI